MRSWIRPRVMSGRSWSMAASMLATTVAMSRRADSLLCSTSNSLSRLIVKIVDAPKPMMSTTTINTVIFAVSRILNTPASLDTRPPIRAHLLRWRGPRMPSTYSEYASGSAALAASHLDPSRRPLPLRRGANYISERSARPFASRTALVRLNGRRPVSQATSGRSRSLRRWRFSAAASIPTTHGRRAARRVQMRGGEGAQPEAYFCTLRACRALANEADGPLSAAAARVKLGRRDRSSRARAERA